MLNEQHFPYDVRVRENNMITEGINTLFQFSATPALFLK